MTKSFFSADELRENIASHEHHDELYSSHKLFLEYSNAKVAPLLTERDRLKRANVVMMESLSKARDVIGNNPKGSYRGLNAGSISAEAFTVVSEGIVQATKIMAEGE